MTIKWRTMVGWLLGLTALLAGCASTGEPRRPCCYAGEVQLARLSAVEYQLAGGQTRPFTQVFAGFKPAGGGFGPGLPFNEARIGEISYDALEQRLPNYDANDNTLIEKPELVVLYLLELARGIGLDVVSVGAGKPASAMALSGSDEQGLITLARSLRSTLAPTQAQIFRELDWVGSDRQRFTIDVSSSN